MYIYTYDVIVRHVYETIVVEKQQVLHTCVCVCVCVCVCARARAREHACVRVQASGLCLHVCSLTYPECNAHAPYFLRSLWLHCIFRHYIINGTIFGKKLLKMKCVF